MQSLNDPPPPLHLAAALPETVGYRLKRRLLGPPLITRQLSEERLSNPLALGVLSSDCISSSAYGRRRCCSSCCRPSGWPRPRCCCR